MRKTITSLILRWITNRFNGLINGTDNILLMAFTLYILVPSIALTCNIIDKKDDNNEKDIC